MIGTAGPHGLAASLRCRCWNCRECNADNKARLYQLILTLAPTIVVTLTSNPHWFEDPAERALRLVAAWRCARRRLRRRYGAKFDFVAVFETTQRGEPHLHIALNAPILRPKHLKELLSEWMRKMIGAPVVSAQPANSRTPGYLCKDPHLFAGCRRFWTSRGWRMTAQAKQAAVAIHSIVKSPLGLVELWAVVQGLSIVERSRTGFKTSVPFFTPP